MSAAVAQAALGLAIGVGALLVTIVGIRVVGGTRRRRRLALRPAVEDAIALYLASELDEPPAFDRSRPARAVLREVALDALADLRGRERERLTALLEREGVVDELAAELGARRRNRRRRAADALALTRSTRTLAPLLASLDDRDALVRAASARALAETADEAVLDRILAAARREVDSSTGAVADVLLALGARRPAALGPALDPSEPPALRELAAAVAGELRLAEHAPLLRDALDGHDELAARAARGLGLIGDADSVEALLGTLEDDGRAWFVRAATARALGAIGDPAAVRALEWSLRSEEWWVQANAAEALALLGEPGDEALRRALESWRPETRAHVKVALEA